MQKVAKMKLNKISNLFCLCVFFSSFFTLLLMGLELFMGYEFNRKFTLRKDIKNLENKENCNHHDDTKVFQIYDKVHNERILAISQPIDSSFLKLGYKITIINESNDSKEYRRSKYHWKDPLYFKVILDYAHSKSLGYFTPVLYVWPNIFYPILFPVSTFLLCVYYVTTQKHR